MAAATASMDAGSDLDEWQHKDVARTESADLVNLEKYATYRVAVAARTSDGGLWRLSEKVNVKVNSRSRSLITGVIQGSLKVY